MLLMVAWTLGPATRDGTMNNQYIGDNARSIYRDAILVQSACNLSGVAHSLVEACQYLREIGGDSRTIERDPAIVLFVAKLADLAGLDYHYPQVSEDQCQAFENETLRLAQESGS